MRVCTGRGIEANAVSFIAVDDRQFQRISQEYDYFTDYDFIREIDIKTDGRHVVIVRCIGDGNIQRLRAIGRELLTQFDSVSWWRKERFYTKLKR